MRAGMMRVLGSRTGRAGDRAEAAVLVTDGVAVADVGESATRAYSPAERALFDAAASGAPEASARAAELVETAHAELLARFAPVDLIGFDAPGLAGPASGAVLAEVLGTPVAWDFRSADLAMGGQGGPLQPFYLHALARRIGGPGPVAFLHLGATAALTWTDPAEPDPVRACLAFDCGPGLAALPEGSGAGQVDDAMLHGFVQHPYFARRPPKRLADAPLPEVGHLGPDDASATLAAAIAAGVVLGFEHFPALPARLWLIGPGRGDARLLPLIAAGCDIPVAAIEDAGLDGAMIAAQSVAFAAARIARGLPTTAPGTTGAAAAVGGGAISRPGAPP